MIKNIKLLSKSKTAKWATFTTLVATLFISNEDIIIEMSKVLLGEGSTDIVSKSISILAVLIGYVGTLNGRLKAEDKNSIPLKDR